MNTRLSILSAVLVLVASARADVTPHVLFTDNMVLQANRDIPVWGTAGPGERVQVVLRGDNMELQDRTIADAKGKWSVRLPKQAATKEEASPLTLTIIGKNSIEFKNVLVGEVWIASGQSNMQWTVRDSAEPEKTAAGATDRRLRLYTVPRVAAPAPMHTIPSKPAWEECTPKAVTNFSAVAYHFGNHLRKALKVPVGMIHTSVGGTPCEAWTSREALEAEPSLLHYNVAMDVAMKSYDPQKAASEYKDALEKWEKAAAEAKVAGKLAPNKPQPQIDPATSPWSPSGLFNAMISPLVRFGIAGAIWYQGESNADRAYEYRTLFPTMIKDWRKRWGYEFPFLFVQLAPWNVPKEQTWPELREAQLLTLSLPRTGMAVITDVGHPTNIHPPQKEPVGQRLALAARAIAYNEPIEYSGPLFAGAQSDADQVTLTFDHVGDGLQKRGERLTGFTIAGKDKQFVPAFAVTVGRDKIKVFSPKVKEPFAVRYGWHNFPEGNLWNKAGLPASPFRTDDWEMLTQPKPMMSPMPSK
jgi:sialate O-acetylesterase